MFARGPKIENKCRVGFNRLFSLICHRIGTHFSNPRDFFHNPRTSELREHFFRGFSVSELIVSIQEKDPICPSHLQNEFEQIQTELEKNENPFIPENSCLELSVSRILFDFSSKSEVFQDLMGDPQRIDLPIHQLRFFKVKNREEIETVLKKARETFEEFTDASYFLFKFYLIRSFCLLCLVGNDIDEREESSLVFYIV